MATVKEKILKNKKKKKRERERVNYKGIPICLSASSPQKHCGWKGVASIQSPEREKSAT